MIDWTKPIRVKNLLGARYVGLSGHPIFSWIVEWEIKMGCWLVDTYSAEGAEKSFENVPEKKELWLNIYRLDFNPSGYGVSGCWESEDLAIRSGKEYPTYVKTIKIEV